MDEQYEHLTLRRDTELLTIQLTDTQLSRSPLTREMESELLEVIENEPPLRVIVDFGRVERCSTAVMNAMLRVKRRLVTRGGQMKLCAMNDSIRDLYKMLNLDGTVFDIHETWEDAAAAF